MRKVLEWLGVSVVTLMLRELLSPVFAPVLGPALPSLGGLIQSAMARQTEAAVTVAIRYAAAGYREPADAVLTLLGLPILVGGVVLGAATVKNLAPLIRRGWARNVLTALMVLATLGVGYVTYTLLSEFQARTNAMNMYKLYQRKIAVLAPYLSLQEAREIDSQWARMDGPADLDAIDDRLLALMRQHGLASSSPPPVKPAD